MTATLPTLPITTLAPVLLAHQPGQCFELRSFTGEESAGIFQVIDCETGLPAHDDRPDVEDALTVVVIGDILDLEVESED